MYALSAFLTVSAGLVMANAATLNPVVLVPGLAGSQIRAKLSGSIEPHWWCKRTETDWFNLWLNVAEVLPEQKDCLMARIALTYNASTGVYSNATGVALDTNVDFGNVSGVASLDPSLPKESGYWLTMIEYLESKFGYVPGLDLHGAPYDWRLAPDGHSAEGAYYDRLKALIETTVSRNGGKGVVIVSHSLGGPTILGFLALQTAAWKRAHVASFVPISAPFAGGTCQALAFVQGDTLGVPFIPSDYLRPIQVTAASGPFVIATPEGFGAKVIVKTDTKNYTAADWPSFLRDLGHAQAAEIFDALHEKQLAVDTLPPPGVPTHVVYSHGTPTRSVFTYEGSFSPGYKKVAKKVSLELARGSWIGMCSESTEVTRTCLFKP